MRVFLRITPEGFRIISLSRIKVTFGTSGACLFIKNKRSETLESNKEEFEMTFVNNEKGQIHCSPMGCCCLD